MRKSKTFPHILSDSFRQTQFLVLIKQTLTADAHLSTSYTPRLLQPVDSHVWFAVVFSFFFFFPNQLPFLTQHRPASQTWEPVTLETLTHCQDLFTKSLLCLLNCKQFHMFVSFCSAAVPPAAPISPSSQHNPCDTRPRLTGSWEQHSRILEQYNINAGRLNNKSSSSSSSSTRRGRRENVPLLHIIRQRNRNFVFPHNAVHTHSNGMN